MTATQVFGIVGMLAMPMWLLMIFVPKWKGTQFLLQYKIVPMMLSLVYAWYIAISLTQGTAFDFSSLASVMELFTKEDAVLAGWVHYLAFDLLVGMWILEKNKTEGIHQILMAPCLFFTFMFGPIGWLLFTILSIIKNK